MLSCKFNDWLDIKHENSYVLHRGKSSLPSGPSLPLINSTGVYPTRQIMHHYECEHSQSLPTRYVAFQSAMLLAWRTRYDCKYSDGTQILSMTFAATKHKRWFACQQSTCQNTYFDALCFKEAIDASGSWIISQLWTLLIATIGRGSMYTCRWASNSRHRNRWIFFLCEMCFSRSCHQYP